MAQTTEQYIEYVKRYFEKYHHASRYTLLLEMSKPQPDWVVLDVGCGIGSASYEIAPYVKEVIATDASSTVIEIAQKHFQHLNIHNVIFKQMDYLHFDFPDNTFDMVLSAAMLHHTMDPIQMLREAKRTLKTNGVLAIWDITGSTSDLKRSNQNLIEQLRDPTHIELLSKFEIFNMLKILNFEIVDTQEMKIKRNLEEWLALIEPPPENVKKIIDLMTRWAEHDEADLDIKIIDGKIYFTQNSIAIVARKPEYD